MKDPYEGIRQSLKTLRLKEIDRLLDEVLAHAMTNKLPVTNVLEQLFAAEAAALIERRIERKPVLTNNRSWTLPPCRLLQKSRES